MNLIFVHCKSVLERFAFAPLVVRLMMSKKCEKVFASSLFHFTFIFSVFSLRDLERQENRFRLNRRSLLFFFSANETRTKQT